MSDPIDRLNAALEDRYRSERELGEGGMATVYLALDPKHNRQVAVKVLRPELAAVMGAERFLAEIETTANLQHPHILPLFDSGEADGFLFYVMPYVEGESLRDRLERERQLPVEDAVGIGRDVADALDYAHRQGVIHRDIKPANILLHDGRPVVADFGIALAVSAAGGGRLTETGLSLGTPHYMSPEQASADRDVTARSDIYSLGSVLYEMLAGQPPYTGPTAQSVLVRILTEDPRPLGELRRTVPPHVASATMKSIEKLPADRFASATEFGAALEDPGFTWTPTVLRRPSTEHVEGAASSGGVTGRLPGWLPWGAVAVLAATLAGLTARELLRPAPPSFVQRYEMESEPLAGGGGGTSFAISPDGSTFAYIGEGGRVYWRPVSALEATVVPESEGSRAPFFSPDGRWLAYSRGRAADDRIRAVPLDGGAPRTLAGDHFPGAAWGDDGFVYYVDLEGSLYRVSDQGGDPELLLEEDSIPPVRSPDPLPGGRGVLVHSWGEAESRVLAVDVESREWKELGVGSHARFAGGTLFWVRERNLFAAPFDPGSMELTGPAVGVAEGLRGALQGSLQYAVSGTGTLVYQTGPASAEDRSSLIGWFDETGEAEIVSGVEKAAFQDIDAVALSPDGRYVAFEAGAEFSFSPDQRLQVWIFDLEGRTATRLTFRGERNWNPRWLPDGRRVAYLSSRAEEPDGIWAQAFDRTGSERLLARADEPITAFDVPPAADLPLVVQTGGLAGAYAYVVRQSGSPVPGDLWLAAGDGSELRPYLVTEFGEMSPRISPDGRWVAYASNESGRMEVYVRAYPDGARPWPVSRNGGWWPAWGRTSEELFYEIQEQTRTTTRTSLVRARLSTGEGVRVVERTVLFDAAGMETGFTGRPFSAYDASAGDGRLLSSVLASPDPADAENEVRTVVVLNLFEELHSRTRE